MLVRLWALAWVARYLKYVPILGWRFSETIVQRLEGRMERDVGVEGVAVNLTDGTLPADLQVEIAMQNELPVDITISGVNVRVGFTDDGRTLANVLWSEGAESTPPKNITTPLVESDTEGTVRVERYLAADAPEDALHVDGSLTAKAWLDVPATKRIPLGTLQCDVPDTCVELPS